MMRVLMLLMLLAMGLIHIKSRRRHSGINFRVWDGKEDVEDKYPYVVSMEGISNGNLTRFCTGTAIASQWVLTASHCFVREVVRVRYGDMTIKSQDSTTYSNVQQVIRHPSFRLIMGSLEQAFNDIGLIQLMDKINITTFAKLSSVDYMSLVGSPVVYVGYGPPVLDNMTMGVQERIGKANEMQRRRIGAGMVKKCMKKDYFPIAYPGICVAPKCSHRAQQSTPGDSGGPLINFGRIVGVCVGSDDYDNEQYTPVSPYLDWIHKVISCRGGT